MYTLYCIYDCAQYGKHVVLSLKASCLITNADSSKLLLFTVSSLCALLNWILKKYLRVDSDKRHQRFIKLQIQVDQMVRMIINRMQTQWQLGQPNYTVYSCLQLEPALDQKKHITNCSYRFITVYSPSMNASMSIFTSAHILKTVCLPVSCHLGTSAFTNMWFVEFPKKAKQKNLCQLSMN